MREREQAENPILKLSATFSLILKIFFVFVFVGGNVDSLEIGEKFVKIC